MKKIFITIMAIFLLINSVGYTIYAHYCNDELKQTSILAKAESCCEDEPAPAETETKDEMSCCAEKDLHVVLKDRFVKSELSFAAISLPVLFITSNSTIAFNSYELPINNYQLRISVGDSSPPIDLGILYSVFRV